MLVMLGLLSPPETRRPVDAGDVWADVSVFKATRQLVPVWLWLLSSHGERRRADGDAWGFCGRLQSDDLLENH